MAEENMGIDQTMAGVPETMRVESSDSLSKLEKQQMLEGGGSVNFGDEVIQDEIAKILRRNSGAELADIEKNNPSLIEEAIRNLSGGAIMPMMDKDEVPNMDAEEREMYRSLMERGIPEDMIIDIMATAKLDQLGRQTGASMTPEESARMGTGAAVNPAEFGGLPKTGSSPASGNPSMQTSPATGNPTGMNQNDMAMYLQNKVAEIKGRTGGSAGMGALSGVPAGNQTPMPTARPVIPQRLGADRTFNPTDQLTPTTTLNT